MIEVSEDVTSIEVSVEGYPRFDSNGYVRATSAERSSAPPSATGARVTIEFFRNAQLPRDTGIRVCYDIAENGGRREMLGIPKLTHTTMQRGGDTSYHYRLSAWIPPLAVMQFVQA